MREDEEGEGQEDHAMADLDEDGNEIDAFDLEDIEAEIAAGEMVLEQIDAACRSEIDLVAEQEDLKQSSESDLSLSEKPEDFDLDDF
jgi:hypothetical protein